MNRILGGLWALACGMGLQVPSPEVSTVLHKGSVVAVISEEGIQRGGETLATFDSEGANIREPKALRIDFKDDSLSWDGKEHVLIEGNRIRMNNRTAWIISNDGTCRQLGATVYRIENYAPSKKWMKQKVATFLVFIQGR